MRLKKTFHNEIFQIFEKQEIISNLFLLQFTWLVIVSEGKEFQLDKIVSSFVNCPMADDFFMAWGEGGGKRVKNYPKHLSFITLQILKVLRFLLTYFNRFFSKWLFFSKQLFWGMPPPSSHVCACVCVCVFVCVILINSCFSS